jgi:hypothetical protein
LRERSLLPQSLQRRQGLSGPYKNTLSFWREALESAITQNDHDAKLAFQLTYSS